MGNLNRRNFLSTFLGAVAAALLAPKRANANALKDEGMPFSPSLATEIAQMFAEDNLAGGLEATNPIPLLDMTGSQIGWSVDYTMQGKPHGYIVFDSTVDGLISRYSEYEGSENLNTTALSSSFSAVSYVDNSPCIVKLSPLDYGAFDERSWTAYDKFGNTRQLSQDYSSTPTTWENLMIDFSEIFGNPYTVVGSDDLGDYWFLTERQIEKHTGTYACGVTALFTIAGLTQFGSRFLIDTTSEYTSDWNAYKILWNNTATVTEKTENGIIYGVTAFNLLGPGFTTYCLNQQNYIQGNSAKWNPTMDDYRNQVANKKHSLFSAQIVDSVSGKETGHIMAVSGWRTLRGYGSTINALVVYDGWNDIVCLNKSFSGYVSTHGTFF